MMAIRGQNETIKESSWYGCYRASWNSAPLVPDAYSHPAKVSFGLAERIYKHMLEQGYIKPGQIIVDPFAGIAGFAFHALMNGLHYKGVELERRFVDLGRQNIELWNGRYSAHFPNFGTAEIIQGDSRYLASVLEGAAAVVGSPPYASAINANGEGPGMAGNEVQRKRIYAGAETERAAQSRGVGYGRSDGQLGNLKEGEAPTAVISSPPFESNLAGGNGLADKADWFRGRKTPGGRIGISANSDYGSTDGNIGNQTGDTFWEASRAILTELYSILTPGGYAAFVCGDYIRDKQRVYFGRQWLAMCEAVGFEGVEWITAWKTEPGPTQTGIFDNGSHTTIERSSFFRKLSNNRARAAEHWKSVSEDDRAVYLGLASSELWAAYELGQTPPDQVEEPVMPEVKTIETLRQYRDDLQEYQRLVTAVSRNDVPPTDGRIMDYARLIAWREAGSEPLNVNGAILNEDVIIVRRLSDTDEEK